MTTQARATLAVPVNKSDQVRGSATARVTLVEYGDYECPYCREAHYVVDELEKLVADSVCFVFRNFPLSTVHPHAEQAAEAAEAAAAQGQFWPMHVILFENQNALEVEDLARYAAALDMNEDQFLRDLSERRFASRVRDDFMGGVRSGVNGTPTFFINGLRHDGPHELQSLLEAINDAR